VDQELSDMLLYIGWADVACVLTEW